MWWEWMRSCVILICILPSCLMVYVMTVAIPMNGDKAYAHYQKIDTKTKMLTFSDGSNLEKAWLLHQYFKDRFQVSFGIGTNLTNDMGQKP